MRTLLVIQEDLMGLMSNNVFPTGISLVQTEESKDKAIMESISTMNSESETEITSATTRNIKREDR